MSSLDPSLIQPPEFVGRTTELTAMKTAWATARGEREMVSRLVSGPAGAGKSALLEHFADELRRAGGRVLSIAYLEGGGALLRLPGGEIREWWAPGMAGATKADSDISLLREDLSRALEAESGGMPTLVWHDDRHLEDPKALDFRQAIDDAVGRLRGEGGGALVVSLFTAGAPGAGETRRRLSSGKTGGAYAREIECGPLSAAEVTSIVQSVLRMKRPPTPFGRRIHAAGGGNPLQAVIGVHALIATGALVFDHGRWQTQVEDLDTLTVPDSPGSALAARLPRMTPLTRAIGEAVGCTGGMPLTVAALAALLEAAQGEVEAACAALAAEGILGRLREMHPEGFWMPGATLRAAIAAGVPESRRSEWARRRASFRAATPRRVALGSAILSSSAGRASTGAETRAASRRVHDVDRLLDINKALNSELDRRRLLELIMDGATSLTGAERGFLLLAKEGGFAFEVARNLDRERIKEPDLKVSHSIAERVLSTGTAVLSDSAREDREFSKYASVADLNLASVLCVPLRLREKTIGALYLDNRFRKAAFSPREQALAEALSDQAAIAIENARLIAENKAKAEELERLNAALNERVQSQKVKLEEIEASLERTQNVLQTKYSYTNIIGRSAAIQKVFRMLDKVTTTTVPVLLVGESGTGKELVARAIHFNGPLRPKAFVAVNCGALTETLLESELFGHVRGAFTGADRDKQGLFEVANGGTLFLDEVGEMTPNMQVKMLRALQDGEIRPVGGKENRRVKVRVICATNRDLNAMVQAGTFREDLFFRLNVVRVECPPLRERREDIPLLVDHFLRAVTPDRPPKPMDRNTLEVLVNYEWPGNVRELENEIHRAVIMSGETIEVKDLSEKLVRKTRVLRRKVEALTDGEGLRTLDELEKEHILRVLKVLNGNKTEAAKVLGIDYSTLWRKMKAFQIGKEG
ncbi:MAG: sigma 54-interacting transcriptional regulator [Planctomycetes bacterium]|nr:sigma 54-interacting transcriptional regulator [Planctomycetota bacterium]